MSEGFLGRWSKRKLDVKEGKEVEAEPLPEPAACAPTPALPQRGRERRRSLPLGGGPGWGQPEEPPPLTLEDVKALTPESDFTRFAASDVAPEVKNAAMKKLFADPRYNVMDGMDVYIDDYSKPDPIPDAMLRKLASAKFLGLFDQEEKEEAEAAQAAQQARDVADNPSAAKRGTVGNGPAQQYPRRLHMPTLICDCNKTMPLQEKSPGRGVG